MAIPTRKPQQIAITVPTDSEYSRGIIQGAVRFAATTRWMLTLAQIEADGTLTNLSGPELVVLGGSLSAAGDMLTAPLRIALDETALTSAAKAVSIELARLGRWASACGAVAFVFEHFTSRQT